jgi:hypothetical protein
MEVYDMEDKQKFLDKICEVLQMTDQFRPNVGHNGLVEIRYIQRNGDEYASPRFEDNPERSDGYYDVNISCDSCIGIWEDITNKFIKRMR